MKLTADQLVEMLEHDEDTDIWLLNQDGSTSIVPDQDITEFQNPGSWPRYICRSIAVDQHVRRRGVDGALEYINFIIEHTMTRKAGPMTLAGVSLGRMFAKRMGV